MKTWTRLGVVIGVFALAVAAGTGAYAMRGGSDGSPRDATPDAGQARPASEDGSPGASSAAMCVAEVPDCNDMIVETEGGAGICAEDADGCADAPCAGGPAVDCIAPEPSGVCYTLDTDPITTRCVETSCAEPAPGGPPVDLPLPVEPQTGAEPAPPVDPGAIGVGCLGKNRCTTSTEMKCLPPDCAVSSDGTIACPEPLPCVAPPVQTMPIAVEPDATAIAEGAGPGAGIPENCSPMCKPPAAPDGAMGDPVPCAMPDDPCTVPQPAPDAGAPECPPATGGAADGSSGSAPSSPGMVEPQPGR